MTVRLKDLYTTFISLYEKDNEQNLAKVLIEAFTSVINSSTEKTMSGLIQVLKHNIDYFFKSIRNYSPKLNHSILMLNSVEELYMYSITKSVRDLKSMDEIKSRLNDIGQRLVNNFITAKQRIFEYSLNIIKANDVL